MPTYDYKCEAGHSHSEVRRLTEPATATVCPDCKKELKRVYAPPAVTFKGNGFYSTDQKVEIDYTGK